MKLAIISKTQTRIILAMASLLQIPIFEESETLPLRIIIRSNENVNAELPMYTSIQGTQDEPHSHSISFDSLLLKSDAYVNAHTSYSFDFKSDYCFSLCCLECYRERCSLCSEETFTSVTGFKDVLTFENREVKLCTPCEHGFCTGSRVKIVSQCGICEHDACEECFAGGQEGRGIVCCSCTRRPAGQHGTRTASSILMKKTR